MFRPFRTRSTRRGNTLIVTLACLSLLAVVGVTAVYYTGDLATRARDQGLPGPEEEFQDPGTDAFNAFLVAYIYDTSDTGQGLLNALRGHSLMRTMYGGLTGATTAWDGVGTFDEMAATAGLSRRVLVNHRILPGATAIYDPEYQGERLLTDPPPTPGPRNFIPKNAAYTYPDMKDFYLASLSPATGEVLLPSYVRPNTPGAFGSLDPSNPNWTTYQGALLTPRPTRFGNPLFPMVPANADNTYTGDVRNRIGGYFYHDPANVGDPFAGQWVARNDSIWIDIGLPPFTTKSGRRVKPLVAPLIIDLDSLLNPNIHGNALAAGAHTSGQGLGPWEVSLARALGPVEAQAIISARGNQPAGTPPPYQTRSLLVQRAFHKWLPAGQQLPSSSAVAWTGNGGANPATSMFLPGSGMNPLFANFPAYAAGFDSTNAAVPAHSSLFIPGEWNSTPSPLRTFAINDTRILQMRHAGDPGLYAGLEVGPYAPTTLLGGPPAFPVPIPNPPQQGTVSGRRMDPAHSIRSLTTTYNGVLDRTGLTPGTNLARAANGNIAGVDINRRLADYRIDPAVPHRPDNIAPPSVLVGMQTVRAAEADRQFLCRDIFARLIVATGVAGATVDINGNITITATPAVPEYNPLRNLAQIAANMCDYRDDDDISTAFVWNPANPLEPFDPANFAPVAPDVIGNHVVFGTEKSRLVINEAYSEHVNSPADAAGVPPTMPSHVRFWVELLNPGNAGAGPQDDGGAQLYYPATATTPSYNPYRIEIARYTRPGATGAEPLGVYLDPAAHPENVTGSFDPLYAPEIRFNFDATSVIQPAQQRVLPNAGTYDPIGSPAQGVMLVAPKVQNPAKTSEFNPAAPDMTTMMPLPPWSGAVIAADPAGATGNNAMAYQTGAVPTAMDVNRVDYKRHVVLLRRLANPHLPESPMNPYVTVDYMDWVPAFDAVLRLMGEQNDRPAGAGGYTDFVNRFAIGKIQPLAGLSVNTAPVAPAVELTPPVFPNSMVLAQNPTTPLPNQPKHTFGRHNGVSATAPAAATNPPGDTIATPYEWLPHMDRPLINQMELIHVTTGKPYQLTQQFIVPDAVTPGAVRKHAGSLFDGSAATSLMFTAQMYRVLELVRIHGHGEGDPLHGRKTGLININTIQDKRIWDSLFDVQAGNGFTQVQVDAMWNALIRSRTVNMQQRHDVRGQPFLDVTGADASLPALTPFPAATVHDMNAPMDATSMVAYDRPYLPFGASQHAAGTGSVLPGGATAFRGGQGIDDTILRRPVNPMTGLPDPTQLPIIFQNAGLHPYQQAEAARKILNNTTTVSNSFAVWVTVGYFDVLNEAAIPAGWPVGVPYHGQLGSEYYREVPADSRRQFFAVVDRGMVALDPASLVSATPFATHAAARPFFTSLESNAYLGATTLGQVAVSGVGTYQGGTQTYIEVYSNGVPVRVGAVLDATAQVNTNTLVIGHGANQEIVALTGVTGFANGYATLQVSALAKNHYAGECVSNVVPGNPGPPPWAPIAPATTPRQFDVNDAIFRPVVPVWTRLR